MELSERGLKWSSRREDRWYKTQTGCRLLCVLRLIQSITATSEAILNIHMDAGAHVDHFAYASSHSLIFAFIKVLYI
jgi:hypothetical protein